MMFRRLTEMLGDLLDFEGEDNDSRRHDRRHRHDDRWYDDDADDGAGTHRDDRRRQRGDGFDID